MIVIENLPQRWKFFNQKLFKIFFQLYLFNPKIFWESLELFSNFLCNSNFPFLFSAFQNLKFLLFFSSPKLFLPSLLTHFPPWWFSAKDFKTKLRQKGHRNMSFSKSALLRFAFDWSLFSLIFEAWNFRASWEWNFRASWEFKSLIETERKWHKVKWEKASNEDWKWWGAVLR